MAASNPTEPDLTSSISTDTDDAPAIAERQGQSSGGADAIAPGMEVIAADGAHLGTVAVVADGGIRLAREPGDTVSEADHRLLPLSLVEAVTGGRVTMRARGDDAFGMAD